MRTLPMALLLVACSCGGSFAAPRHPGYDELDRTVVALVSSETGNAYCAGVILDVGILTAAHCVGEVGDGAFVGRMNWLSEGGLYMQASIGVEVVRTDAAADLALLSNPLGWASWSRIGPRPALGEEVVACGSPSALAFVCMSGHVSGSVRHGGVGGLERGAWYTMDAGAVPGMSGGPVFDRQGQVVGIVSFYGGSHFLGGVIAVETIERFLHTRTP